MKNTSAPHFALWIAAGCLALASVSYGQTLYVVRKNQILLEINGTSSGSTFTANLTSPPSGGYVFSVQAATPITLALPSGGTQPLPASAPSGNFSLVQAFSSQAGLDAAFPNGTYGMSGPNIPALSLALTPDSYPSSTPGLIRTNWNNGLLVVDPSQSIALTFGNNPSYATGGVGAHMNLRITGLTDSVSLGMETWNKPVFGFPVTATSTNSFTIPANALAPGRVYFGELTWDIATTLDTTTIPNAGVLALYTRTLRFFIVAQGPADTPPPPPVIVNQPSSQTVFAGSSASFNLGLTVGGTVPAGNGVPTVLWYFNGERLTIDGSKYIVADGRMLTVNNVTAADVGRYFAYVANAGGLVTSIATNLALMSAPPSITRLPASVTVAAGSTAVFSVNAVGGTGVTYQWRLNGVNVPASFPGANGPILVLPNATAAQAGTYSVVVTNNIGSVTSSGATLTIASATSDPGRLINLSILTPLTAGETMTMGAALGGAGTTGNKPLLIRAAGPSLAALDIRDFLPDPRMTLNFISPSPAVVVASNNDWGGTAALNAAFASVGAFPFASATSKDAALFQGDASALAPGNYTVEVRDAGSGTGTMIAELYDATPSGALTATTPRLINVSVLKSIAAGSSLTAGFVVGGTTAKTVLIRAIGPGLVPLGVSGAMPDPQLTLNYTTPTPSVIVATNNDWNGDTALVQTAGRVGAFAITNPSSKDAMLLVALAPGNYTAEVSPVPGTAGGTAIVEVYEVP